MSRVDKAASGIASFILGMLIFFGAVGWGLATAVHHLLPEDQTGAAQTQTVQSAVKLHPCIVQADGSLNRANTQVIITAGSFRVWTDVGTLWSDHIPVVLCYGGANA
jgi:hypothetical protein